MITAASYFGAETGSEATGLELVESEQDKRAIVKKQTAIVWIISGPFISQTGAASGKPAIEAHAESWAKNQQGQEMERLRPPSRRARCCRSFASLRLARPLCHVIVPLGDNR
jgi:hypothetical protein